MVWEQQSKVILMLNPLSIYQKNPKHLNTGKNWCNYLKILTVWFYSTVTHTKDVDRIANSIDPDLTAPSSLFAQTYLSENLESFIIVVVFNIFLVLFTRIW